MCNTGLIDYTQPVNYPLPVLFTRYLQDIQQTTKKVSILCSGIITLTKEHTENGVRLQKCVDDVNECIECAGRSNVVLKELQQSVDESILEFEDAIAKSDKAIERCEEMGRILNEERVVRISNPCILHLLIAKLIEILASVFHMRRV